jgi:long-subunit acyl-CoA synthetase (AMP-forming)
MKLYINGKNVDPYSLPDVKDWLSGKPLLTKTSGTSGYPKAVNHSHEVMQQIVRNNVKAMGHHKKTKMLSILNPKGIGFQSMMLYVAIEADCDLYLEDFNPATYVDRMNEIKPTYSVIAPNIWRSLHRREKWKSLDLSYCETFVMGGDFTPHGALDELRLHGPDRVLNVYGSTEVPPVVLYSEEENRYSHRSTPEDVEVSISETSTLLCKWKAQSEWWDSGDLVSGLLSEFELKGRQLNMFKQNIQRIYPEELEKAATDCGADLALCREDGRYAHIYYTGDLDEDRVRNKLSFVPKLRVSKVNDIKIDENLRKVLRNQELEVSNEYR